MPTAKQKAAQERFRAAARQARREGKKGKSYARRVGELLRGRASHGAGHKTKSKASSGSSKHSSAPSSGGRSRMAKKVPLPVIGIRGSETAVSVPKATIIAGVGVMATKPSLGQGYTPVQVALGSVSGKYGKGPVAGLRYLADAVLGALRTNRNAQAATVLAAGSAVFGKHIDRRLRGFPLKFRWR